MHRSTIGFIVSLSAFLFLGAGCISFKGAAKADGGLFITGDRGEKWAQRGAIPTTGQDKRSLANTDITMVAQDPQDPRALYIGTDAQGGFYTWDGGGAWWPLGQPFAGSRVDAIAVDPKSKCTIYVAAGQKIYKSNDCTRGWRSSDFEATITALAIDPIATATLYAGNSKGDILKSTDGGASWRAITRLENRVKKILIAAAADGRGPVTIIAATQSAGLYRSVNNGDAWTDLRPGLGQFEAAFDYKAIVLAPDHPGTILYASKYGLLRSPDFGATWQPLTLITAPGAVDIFSLAVNPKKSDEIAYATATTFYKSSDGGRSWVSKKLPTSRAASCLFVDQEDGNIIWMGTVKVKK